MPVPVVWLKAAPCLSSHYGWTDEASGGRRSASALGSGSTGFQPVRDLAFVRGGAYSAQRGRLQRHHVRGWCGSLRDASLR